MGKWRLKFIGALVILLLVQGVAYAAKGGLNLSAVTMVGGGNVQDAADIPTEPQFIVQFDKNVVNSAIWEHNSKCISLITTDNENVPLNVTRVDDAVDFAQRQNIFVQPVQPLRPGTAYDLKISPDIKAKNGATLGREISVSFKTREEVPVQPPQPAENVSEEKTCDSAGCAKQKEACGKDECTEAGNN